MIVKSWNFYNCLHKLLTTKPMILLYVVKSLTTALNWQRLSTSKQPTCCPRLTLSMRIDYGYCVIFTARRVCIARTMPWQDVCLSVCLSHAGIECKRLYISSKKFFTIWQPHNSSFSILNGMAMTPNARGYEKITIYAQYLASSRN